ncbi:MAG: alpha/beta fold hydrolase [Acidobacteriota bacterium]|nr:alpha/beta fold hydrolase [Acidobacteriota bacterium]
MKRILVLALFLCATAAHADLPRRAAAGLAVGAEEETVIVRDVFPNTAAQQAGLQRGDVIVSIDSEAVSTAEDVTSRLGRKKAGNLARIEYIRANEKGVATLTMKEWPREQSEIYDVTYGEVTADGNHYRTLLTQPKSGPARATIFMVQGVGCASIDNPPPGHSYRALVNSFTRNGFATLRVDKPGVGDSEGGPCKTAAFATEVNAYRAALSTLKDRQNVFYFGHSMGGIMAPLITSAHPSVRGIVVYGTTYRSWFQYTLDNLHRQGRMEGASYEALADDLRGAERFNALFFAEKWPIEKIVAQYPVYKEMFPDGTYAGGKAGKYFQDMYDAETIKAWKATNAPVLAVYGASDFVTEAREHEMLAKAVNSWRPGTARFVQLEGIDHWLRNAPDQKQSAEQGPSGGEYNDALAEAIAAFVKENAK